MIGALCFNLIAVILAKLAETTEYKNGLIFSILFIFLFLALRYDYGNDYFAYLDIFNEINSYSNVSLSNFSFKGNEVGWVYFNYFFGPFGFFTMQIVLAGFSCIVLYRFIKKYVLPKYYWWAIFIHTFQPYHMLVQSSAMRQAVVISLFLLSIDFLIKKKPIHYIAIILFGSLFHSTAYFLLPLVFLPYFNFKLNLNYIVFIILFVGLFFFINQITNQIQQFISLYFENEYSVYIQQDLKEYGVGIGFFLNVIIYMFLFYYLQYEKLTSELIIRNVVVISFLLIPISFSNLFISRLNFYFTPLLMVAFPLAFENIKNKFVRNGYMLFVAFFTLYQFFYFFVTDTWVEKFYQYKTIFSAPTIY
jgi:transmembrane protein EpsG